MKRFLSIASLLALTGATIVACSDDPTPGPPGSSVDAGPHDASHTDATTSRDAGEVDASRDAGPGKLDATTSVDAGDAAPLDASTNDAGDASVPLVLDAPGRFAMLFGGSSQNGRGELTVVDLATATYAGRYPTTSVDSLPFASGRKPFLAQRDLGKLLVMDANAPWVVTQTVTLTGGNDVSGVAADDGTKAYVTRPSTNSVLVVNTATGAKIRDLDLSPFAAAADTDGIVGVSGAAFDTTTKRVYFLLDRVIFRAVTTDVDEVSECLPTGAAIVAFDTTTDTVVDLNGAAPGQAIDLQGSRPLGFVPDLASGRLLIVHNGCYVDNGLPHDPDGEVDDWAGVRQGRGVEAVRVATGATTWLYQSTDKFIPDFFIYADAHHAFITDRAGLHPWDPTTPMLGAAMPAWPRPAGSLSIYDGRGHVVGVNSPTISAGGTEFDVASWDVRTFVESTMIASEVFLSPRTAETNLRLSGSAIVR